MKISVLTPSFNSVKFIERAIKSVQIQNYNNCEHIIVDGCSTDGTVEKLKKYPHVIWRSEPDKGQSDAMNKAFELATGDVIVYLNADDYFEPQIFADVVAFFERTDADMVVGNLVTINSKKDTKVHHPSTQLEDILDVTALRFPLNPVSYFYKKELQGKIGPFPVDNHSTMDYWFLLRAYQQAKICHLDKVFGVFDNHGANKTSAYFETKLSQLKVIQDFCNENEIASAAYVTRLFEVVLSQHRKMVEAKTQQDKKLAWLKQSVVYRTAKRMGII